MGVNLSGAKAAVAEQLLHASDIGTCVQQVRCKAVSEGVRADPWIEPRLGQVLFQQTADAAR
jgi:hypothetical protein